MGVDRAPLQAAQARWRQAEALRSPRASATAAAEAAAQALAQAERLGSRWLADELQTLIERARLDVAGANPVGQATPTVPPAVPNGIAAPDDRSG